MLEDLLFGSFGVGGPEQNDLQFWRKIWCERRSCGVPVCTEEKLSVCCFQPIRFQDSMLFFIMWPADLRGLWVGSELWCYTELSLFDKNKNCRGGKPAHINTWTHLYGSSTRMFISKIREIQIHLQSSQVTIVTYPTIVTLKNPASGWKYRYTVCGLRRSREVCNTQRHTHTHTGCVMGKQQPQLGC